MPVCTELDYLYALKKIDDNLSSYTASKDDYNLKKEEFSKKIEKIEAWVKKAEAFVKDLRKNEDLLNLKRSDYEQKKARIDQKIQSVKNNKEYQALVKEKESLESKIDKTDEELLDIMEKFEKCHEEISRMNTKKCSVSEEFSAFRDEQEKLISENNEHSKNLVSLREKVVLKIKKRHYEGYEVKRGKIKKAPVFEMNGGNCPYCGFEISQSLKNGVTALDGINCCNECGVILYWPGTSEIRACSSCGKLIDTDTLISALLDDKPLVCSKCQTQMDVI
jgi:predicted  nucleic acid-binding Zn-ribbon protein